MPIPHTIHQIWLGKDRPWALEHCRASLLSLHPKWEYHRWTDEDVDSILNHEALAPHNEKLIAFYRICMQCNKHNPLATTSDLLRLLVVYIHGGLYLDCDCYGLRPLGRLADTTDQIWAEIVPDGLVGEAVIGAAPRDQRILGLILAFAAKVDRSKYYRNRGPAIKNVNMDCTGYCRKHKIQPYPPEYFIPHERHCPPAHRYRYTSNTHCIHL